MYDDEYASKEKHAQRTTLCHSPHLFTHGQKENRPLQNKLVPYCEEREGNGRLKSPGRERELWLRSGASGKGVMRSNAQQSAKKIGEVRCKEITIQYGH